MTMTTGAAAPVVNKGVAPAEALWQAGPASQSEEAATADAPGGLGGADVVAPPSRRGPLDRRIMTRSSVSGRPLVVKTLADHLAGDPVRRAQFLRAAELGMRLSHPNVVRVFEAGIEGRPYVVMEYIDGETLTDRAARNGRLSPAETLTLATHLAAGLAHAHANGVVHGALVPDSIVVGDDGVARIDEFGFARLLAGEERPTPADDVYGWAMVLRRVGSDALLPALTALIDAAAAHPSVRPSAFDVLHRVHTVTGPPDVWLPPAGVHIAGDADVQV